MVILKAARRLLLVTDREVLASFDIALGFEPEGPKDRQGDGRTPEGSYVLDWRTDDSEYYRAIHISYPNADDRRRAKALGVPPGGHVMIHGLPNGLEAIGRDHAKGDWTRGCIAVSNEELDHIWASVPNGTPIEIFP